MDRRFFMSAFGVGVFIGSICVSLFTKPKSDLFRFPAAVEIPEEFFVKDLDTDLGEKFESNDFNAEKKYISEIVGIFIKFIKDVKEKNGSDLTTRGAHARSLACLKGELQIQNQSLPENLRVGLYSKDQQIYKTWVRVSNTSRDPIGPDQNQQTRGFALKIFGVNGPKLIDNQDGQTMDMLNIALENFVVADNVDYPKVAKEEEGKLAMAWRLGVERMWNLLDSVFRSQREQNPMRLEYFSAVPYRLGPANGPKKAIKSRVVLCDPKEGEKFPSVKHTPDNVVSNILSTIRIAEELCYSLQIQVAGPKDNVEDSTTGWDSEYITVAKLKISSKDNLSDNVRGRQEFCENLSFNPWRTLEVHRPLGRTNRARKTTYLMSSMFRHSENNVEVKEPDVTSFEKVP